MASLKPVYPVQIIILIMFYGIHSNKVTCPDKWILYRNSCYYFNAKDDLVTWYRAESDCLELFGHLAIISSKKENEFIKQKSKDEQRNIWFGATYSHKNGGWMWASTKQRLNGFTDWSGNQTPSKSPTSSPVCAYMSKKTNQWSAGNCKLYGYYVCEIELD